jgi:uncharacterized protein YfaS (alpha-2-macroglobulin family)
LDGGEMKEALRPHAHAALSGGAGSFYNPGFPGRAAMRRLTVLLFALLLAAALPGAVRASEPLDIPGLNSDAAAYAASLAKAAPAGATPAAREKAQRRASDAAAKQDWPAAAAAWEARVGLGEPSADDWLALAQAQLRRQPQNLARAAQAAWRAYDMTEAGADQLPALLLLADALRLLDRPGPLVAVLEAAAERAPGDARVAATLADARRAAGLLVRHVSAEPDADPPRVCIDFSAAPARRDDFHPADWIRLDPPLPGAAITREGDQICVSGLPFAATTRITVRAGLPGEGGLAMKQDAVLPVAIGNRRASIVFDQRMFLLPRGQAPKVSLSTVNLSAVKLTLVRVTERNVVAMTRDQKLGAEIEAYETSQISDQFGRVVWEGRADIPRFEMNRTQRTSLPLPDALLTAGPGVYALIAKAGDGTPDDFQLGSVQMILRTDLAPTVWRGADGLTVQVRGYSDAEPKPGAVLRLMSASNDVLAEARADGDGVARFAAPLLHGLGSSAPRAVHVTAGDDFATLDLDDAAFDLSDRGVSGQPHPGPLDAFVYLDRGIYRPGETVQVMALLRDAAGAPADFPAQVTVRRPNGQVFLKLAPPRGPGVSIHLPVTLSTGAATGTWTVEVRSEPDAEPIGRAQFRVDAFVPDRMAVELGDPSGPIAPGAATTLPLTARFLYGAPGAHLSGKASLLLVYDPNPFPGLAGFSFGLDGEAFAPQRQDVAVPETDAAGRATLSLLVPEAPDTTHPLRAEVEAEIDDPSGHAARATASVPVRAAGPVIGIKPLFDGGAVDDGAPAAFELAALNPDGARERLHVRLRLVRERPDYRLVFQGRLAHYQTVWKDEPLETSEADIPADQPLRVEKRLAFGRYRLEALQAGGLAATSVRFRSGWASSSSPDVPDQADVSVASPSYAPGAVARIHVAPPFGGEATVLVLSDRVHSLRTLPMPAAGADVDVPVGTDWGPGAYVAVHVFRPGADSQRPGRAIGLVWVGVDPAAHTLPVAIDAPEKLPPRSRAVVPVRTAPGAWVTLAAVDEGVLRLTGFVSPDPVAHFLGRRSLGLDIRDDWGRLIAPADGEPAMLSQGGDDGSFALPDTPQRTVSLFMPPVQAGADGIAAFPLDLPDFAGQVRLMAVAWSGDKTGAAHAEALVRDPLVAEPLLPRFLAPGDDSRLSVLLQNLELPAGEAVATVSVDGPLTVTGPARLAATLAGGELATPFTTLRATGAGRGVVRLDVTGPAGFHVQREAAITVRPARGRVSVVAAGELAGGADARLAPDAARFIPGTWTETATFGGAVRYDAAALFSTLDDYSYYCLEQSVSKGLPFTFAPDGPLAGPERAARLQAAAFHVMDLQRYDGGFGLWAAHDEAEPWLSAYATEFLWRAKAAGAAVPDAAIVDAVKFLSDAAGSEPASAEDVAAQAYRLYVLALTGQGRPGAARVLAENPDSLPTPLARAQLAAALAMGRDRRMAETLFRSALDAPARGFWHVDYGTALRDQTALAVLLRESGLLPDRMAGLLAALPGANLDARLLSTQEQAWLAAAAGLLGRDGAPAKVEVDGRAIPPSPIVAVAVTTDVAARNLDSRPVWQTVSTRGVPAAAEPAARSRMRVGRRFLAQDGSPLDLDHLKQNTVFTLLLEGRADDGQDHEAMLAAGLPAGWEIAGRYGEGAVPGQDWLGALTATVAQPAADDRFAAVLHLSPDAPAFRIAVKLRAVTPGAYELPGAEVSDMYAPAVFARQSAGRVIVLPAQ